MSGHLPPGFTSWPRETQVSHLTLNSRKGLIAMVLAEADVDLETRTIESDEQLTKRDLAMVYCRILEGSR